MKRLLGLVLVLLSVCVLADERIIFGSLERESETEEFNTLGVDIEETDTLHGFGAQWFKFRDEGIYQRERFTVLTGDRQACLLETCNSFDTRKVIYSQEVGIEIGQWIPFVGMSLALSKVEFETDTDSEFELTKGLIAGTWLKLDTFVLRVAVLNFNDKDNRVISTTFDDEDNRTISGGLLFQMDNNFVLGAEIGMLLDSKEDGFSFSLQIGRSF
ncbi:MAG: hypothetical protein F4W92_09160 [Gammaproteobacteria bacterium]|nr:hypothetical protein [Gammaproteobacteria bacterium]